MATKRMIAAPAEAAAPPKAAVNTAAGLSKPVIFATSGLGGVAGWCVVHPFNTVAIRMNLAAGSAASGAAPKGFLSFASELISKEGVGSLYAGLSAGCFRQIFYASARLGLFEIMRDASSKYRKPDFAQRFCLASVAGGAAALISCPVEVCLVRMSNDAAIPAAERRGYKGVFDAMARIMSEEGPAAFYRGSQPFVMRAMVVGGTQVATYDQFKQIFGSLGLSSPIANTFCSAFSAGLIYSIITMPLETAKNRMAFQKPDAAGKLPYTSTFQTVTSIARAEGTLALWNGFAPYYLRCGGHTVSMFICVDQIRQFYRKMGQ